MLSHPKASDTRRVIVNLSHPFENSINDCISNQCYDGVDFNLKYPTVDSIIDAIREKEGDVLLNEEFNLLHSLFKFLGLLMNPHKIEPPTTKLTCMDIHFNIAKGVEQYKCTEILDVCRLCLTKHRITRKQLQSLLGKLLYLHRCMRRARTFVNRFLNRLRQYHVAIPVCDNIRSDLLWFMRFMERFNGRTIFNHRKEHINVHIDASLTGMGAIWDGNIYAASRSLLRTFSFSIKHLEMANVLLALSLLPLMISTRHSNTLLAAKIIMLMHCPEFFNLVVTLMSCQSIKIMYGSP